MKGGVEGIGREREKGKEGENAKKGGRRGGKQRGRGSKGLGK